jgi:hypothetical protein
MTAGKGSVCIAKGYAGGEFAIMKNKWHCSFHSSLDLDDYCTHQNQKGRREKV